VIEPYESERQCKRCGLCKPLSCYSPSKRGAGGYQPYCKPCRSEYSALAQRRARKTTRAKAPDREEIWPRPLTEALLDLKLRNFRAATAGQLTWRV
jgi:hypothetical protein